MGDNNMGQDKFTLDFVSNPQNFFISNNNHLETVKSKKLLLQDFVLYHVEELTFEEQSPRKEAFENVISSLRVDGVSFLYLILGDQSGVHFYFGVVRNLHEHDFLALSVSDIGEQILEPSLRGNFRGSKINEVKPEKKKSILDNLQSMSHFGILEGVPGINEDSEDFQGVDRLIDVMLGDQFGLAIISKPLKAEEIQKMEKQIYSAYEEIVPFVKKSVQEGTSQGTSGGQTITNNNSDSVANTHSKAVTENATESEDSSHSSNIGTTKTTTKTSGSSSAQTQIQDQGAKGSTNTKNNGLSKSKSEAITTSTSTTKNSGESVATSNNVSHNTSNTVSVEFIKKEAQEWIKYLDEVILPRLDYGKSKGVFVTSALLFTDNKGSLIKLGNTMKSLYSGKSGNKVPLSLVYPKNTKLVDHFKNLQLPFGVINGLTKNEIHARSAISQFVMKDRAYLGNWISTNELSLIAGLPQKEVVGLALKEEVEFGLNAPINVSKENQIKLGRLVQSGRVLDRIEVSLDKENLNKHIFVTGVTGSGKTTTCQKLLIDSNLPFLVIEPAKTEYRILTEQYDDLYIFTLGKNTVAPFRLNPFEFFPHESITSRVDMIKASLESSFDMEAAIPQIIETAIYQCYQDYGWNIATNVNERYENPFTDGIYAFPTLENLVNKIEVVVKDQGFDDRLKNDYIGSIKARLQGLLIGSKGLMLNTKRSIDFESLVEKRVVLELEEIKSGSEKSLIMGFVLANLNEAMKAKYIKTGGQFKHITLIEEAHRLLSKFVPGDSLNKKQGVEVFSDMLAEVRKYGESLIIVDQIPDKLTSEVLKNTNTKIVHKIFAADDKEAIGNTMALTDDQKQFLSNLEVGRAIVFTQGWSKAIQVQITQTTNTTGSTIVSEAQLRQNILKFYQKEYKRGVLQGLEWLDEEPTLEMVENFLDFLQSEKLSKEYFHFVSHLRTSFPLKTYIEESLLPKYSINFLAHYLTNKFYLNEENCSLEERYEHVKDFLYGVLTDTIKDRLQTKFADAINIRR
jgi:DNA helicase HerA-like ATPase